MREERKKDVTDDRLLINLHGFSDDPKLVSLKVKRQADRKWTIIARFSD